MSLIHFIHISDLHLNKEGFETDTMREKLPNYIKSLNKNPINYIFFTGDLRYAPQKEYPQCAVDYFAEICAAANISKDRLYIAIGNHDVIREDSKRLSAIETLQQKYFDDDQVIASDVIDSLKSGRDEYYTLLSRIISPEQYQLHSDNEKLHFLIKTNDVNIVIVDSTLCYKAQKEHDLIIGAHSLKKVLKKCDITKPTIVLSHYALDNLETNEQRSILRVLKDNHIQLWLAGHKHNDIIRKELDYVYTAQSGNQTFEKGASPGFVEGFLDTDKGCGYFCVHKWNKGTDWSLYLTLVDNTDEKDNAVITDRTKYRFTLNDWRRVNKITGPSELELSFEILNYLDQYGGSSFFNETIMDDLDITEEELLPLLKELQAAGYIKSISGRKKHWEIIKKTTSV